MGTAKLSAKIRQEQIAEAALDLVASHGLSGLSMAGVARRIGLVPSAIYRHFKNKDQVLDTLLDLIRERLLANVKAVCEETSDPLERLRRLLARHVNLIRENKGIPRILFSGDVYKGHAERKIKVYRTIKEYLSKVAEIVRQGQKEGRVRADFDPESVATMFLGMIQPAAFLWHMSDGVFDVTKQTERAWRIFSAAIRCEQFKKGGAR